VIAGSTATILIAAFRETVRLADFVAQVPADKSLFVFLDPSTTIGPPPLWLRDALRSASHSLARPRL
jgi:hypothetical protein